MPKGVFFVILNYMSELQQKINFLRDQKTKLIKKARSLFEREKIRQIQESLPKKDDQPTVQQ
jgi:hypothetical protein